MFSTMLKSITLTSPVVVAVTGVMVGAVAVSFASGMTFAGDSDSPYGSAENVVRDASQDPVHWSARLHEGDIGPGQTIKVGVNAAIDSGWYIYSITQGPGGPVATRISVPDDQPFLLDGEVTGSSPTERHDQNFDMQVEVHEGAVAYVVPVTIAAPVDPARPRIRVNARYQACTNRICLPAQTERLTVRLNPSRP